MNIDLVCAGALCTHERAFDLYVAIPIDRAAMRFDDAQNAWRQPGSFVPVMFCVHWEDRISNRLAVATMRMHAHDTSRVWIGDSTKIHPGIFSPNIRNRISSFNLVRIEKMFVVSIASHSRIVYRKRINDLCRYIVDFREISNHITHHWSVFIVYHISMSDLKTLN